MHEVIQFLEEKIVLSPQEFKGNIQSTPLARRYRDEIKEFALTLFLFS